MPSDTLLERALASARESAYLGRVGFRVESAADGQAQGRLDHRDVNANRAGAVHGGAIATVLVATAELAAAASQRGDSTGLELLSSTTAISFLDAVRDRDDLAAAARVLRRGRDTIHVGVEARTTEGATVATALLAYRLAGAPAASGMLQPGRAADSAASARGGELAGSAYMGAGQARVLDVEGEWSCMSLPLVPNEGARGRVHEGAVIGLIDTCAALATHARTTSQARPTSATLSLSAAWAGPLDGDLVAAARVLGGGAGTFMCEAQVWTASDRLVRTAGLVCYRIAAPGAGR